MAFNADEMIRKQMELLRKGTDFINCTTEEVTDVGKILAEIHKAEEEMEELYIRIGKEATGMGLSIFKSAIERIKVLKRQIADNEAKVNERLKIKDCPKCGTKMNAGAKFCPECGIKL